MKRKNYTITSTEGQTKVRHTWNTARQQVVAFARELANKAGCSFRQLSAEYRKDDAGNHVHGALVWQGDNGTRVTFTIERTQ